MLKCGQIERVKDFFLNKKRLISTNLSKGIDVVRNFEITNKLNSEIDWYGVRSKEFQQFPGGKSLLNKHGSILNLLKEVYPNFQWNEHKFQQKPRSFWQYTKNQRLAMDEILQKLNITTVEQMKKCTNKNIRENGGSSVLHFYSGVNDLFANIYPEYKDHFSASNFRKKPMAYWNDISNQREYVEEVGKKLNIKTLDDWYSIPLITFCKHQGHQLVKLYKKVGMIGLLSEVFPEKEWNKAEMRSKLPNNFWKSKENRRKVLENFFQKYEKEYNIKSITDWINIPLIKYKDKAGVVIKLIYKGSTFRALSELFPEYEWNVWDKNKLPLNFWQSIDNQNTFMDSVYKQLNFTSFKDWYSLTQHQLISLGGRGLLSHYKGNVYHMLRNIYPNENWNVFDSNWQKRGKVNLKYAILLLQKELNIRKKSDWYRVSRDQVIKTIGASFLVNGILYDILNEAHPDQRWSLSSFSNRLKKSAQRNLFISTEKMFPYFNIYEEYSSSYISFINYSAYPEFDVFIPELNIALEYQGEQHYNEIASAFSPLELYQARDNEKIHLCSNYQIQLLLIPYWFDHSFTTLQSLILYHIMQYLK